MFVKQDLFFSPPKPFLSHFFFKNNNIPSKISSFSWNNTSKVSAFSSLSSNKSNLSHNVAFPVSSKPFTMFLPKTSTFAIGISRKERYVERKVDEITDKVVATLKKPVEERLKIFEDVVIKLLKEKKIYDGSKINLGTILSMGANDAVKVILVKGCVIKPSEKLESEDQVFVEKKTEEEKKNKTLWIGELQQWMEEKYILISFHGKVESVKIIRNRRTGRSKGYGFIELATRSEAARVLRMLDGSPMPSCDQNFRLMWSYKRSRVRRQPDGLITRDQ